MSFIATAVVSNVYQTRQARKAKKEAKADALEDRRLADEEELFSETEGEGLGQLGKVSLDIDDEEEDDKLSSTVSI